MAGWRRISRSSGPILTKLGRAPTTLTIFTGLPLQRHHAVGRRAQPPGGAPRVYHEPRRVHDLAVVELGMIGQDDDAVGSDEPLIGDLDGLKDGPLDVARGHVRIDVSDL